MRKAISLLVIGTAFVFFLSPRPSGARRGVLVGSFNPDLQGMSGILDVLNEELETDLRFKENGLMYSFVDKRYISLRWRRGLDVSFYSTKAIDSVSVRRADNRKSDIYTELGLMAVPVFLTRIYEVADRKQRLCPYLGVGVGIIVTVMTGSYEEMIYSFDPEANSEPEEVQTGRKRWILPNWAGQLLVGIEYRLTRKYQIMLEARYITASEAEIREPTAKIRDKPTPIEGSVDWSGFSYRVGLTFGF